MKKKQIYIVIFVVLFFQLLLFFSEILRPKNNEAIPTISYYYKMPKGSVNAAFFGDSTVHRGINPMILYEEYNLATYTLGSPAERIFMTYHSINDALKAQDLDYVILNASTIFITRDQNLALLQNTLDSKPFGINKIRTVFSYEVSFKEKMKYLFPIFRYHDRWKKINNYDLGIQVGGNEISTRGYGFLKRHQSIENRKYTYFKKNDKEAVIPKKNQKILDDIVKLCKNKNKKLVLISIPSVKEWDYAKYNTVKKYAKENNLEYFDLNLYVNQMGLSFKEDFTDRGAHLNIYGAEKVSRYLGKYLVDLGVEPVDKKHKKFWDEDLKTYKIQLEKFKRSKRAI